MKFSPAKHDKAWETFEQALPEIARRLDHVAVAHVSNWLATHRTNEPLPEGLDARVWSIWTGLFAIVDEHQKQLELSRDEWRRFLRDYNNWDTPAERADAIRRALEAEEQSWWGLFRDVRALERGWLDLDVLRERQISAEQEHVAILRVSMLAIERLGQNILHHCEQTERARLSRALIGPRHMNHGLRAASFGRDQDLAWASLRCVQAPLSHLLGVQEEELDELWLTAAIEWSVRPNAHSWLQRTAMDILARDRLGEDFLVERLTKPMNTQDDWHVRAHCITLLEHIAPTRLLDLTVSLLEQEPEDGVICALCGALGKIADPRSTALLGAMLGDSFGANAQVRVAAGLACANLVRQLDPNAVHILVKRLTREQDPEVLLVTKDALLEALIEYPSHSGQAQLSEKLREAIARRLETEPDAAIANTLNQARLELTQLGQTRDIPEEMVDLAAYLSALGHAEQLTIDQPLSPAALGQAMVLATRDSYGLYARPKRGGGWRVERGARARVKLWRVLHELRNPSPNKRQDISHAHGRVFPGALRAHSDSLGEVTPTAVPGERRQVMSEGGWGSYLPLIDDLLDANASRSPVTLVSHAGLTRIIAPKSALKRARNALRIAWSYAALDQLRAQSIAGSDAEQRGYFLAHIERDFGLRTVFEPFAPGDPVAPPVKALFPPPKQLEGPDEPPKLTSAAAFILPILGALEVFDSSARALTRVWGRLFSRGQVRAGELIVVMMLSLSLYVIRMFFVRQRIEAWRDAIPLSIGGWGTRGKSGTERLKAGMFHGLGYEVFVKTTGCEAMFIHAPRGDSAREIFIYRPYDKASIWEQRDMLSVGARVKTDVFLWECMALNPRYVEILESDWMRDDLCTLTNAYPDHEDIQGPAGVNVAETISRFIPRGKRVITAEREMLPILKRVASERGTTLTAVGPREELSLPESVLARFPYREHPRNIALVAKMAEHLGIDPEYAIFQMADHVVADLGVLKVYPTIELLGRKLTFINGCSANERAGFMNNWRRMKLDQLDPFETPEKIVVTVVNNRADRIARSVVFANILVTDIAFDRHVLIGTNLSGLKNYMKDALDAYFGAQVLLESVEDDPDTVRARVHNLLRRVRVLDYSTSWLEARQQQMLEACALDPSAIALDQGALEAQITAQVSSFTDLASCARALQASAVFANASSQLEAASAAANASRDELLHANPEEVISEWAALVSLTIAARWVERQLDATLSGSQTIARFHEQVRQLWEERFWGCVHTVEDSGASGDHIITEVARHTPPGADVQIMGTQNIKGTGLDFVYRWVDLDATAKTLEASGASAPETTRDQLAQLGSSDSLSLADALWAYHYAAGIAAIPGIDTNLRVQLDSARQQLGVASQRALAKALASGSSQGRGWGEQITSRIESFIDPIDAIWRRHQATKLERLFIARRISHKKMAKAMQELNKRQKGGWLLKLFAKEARV